MHITGIIAHFQKNSDKYRRGQEMWPNGSVADKKTFWIGTFFGQVTGVGSEPKCCPSLKLNI